MNHIRHITHIILSTYNFRLTIPEATKCRLLDYISGVIRRRKCHVHAINSHLNHLHILVELQASSDLPVTMNKIKGSTASRFRGADDYPDFTGWNPGYDSFMISYSDLTQTIHDIENQSTIHQTLSFEDEYRTLLRDNGFDE